MILLDSVTKTYPRDKVPALDNVSLHISPGEFAFLVGKSGAGKSTLIKMITREETKDSGKIFVGGIDLDYVKRRHIPHYRRRLGVVFQDFKLLPRRTVYENVAFALEIAGVSTRDIKKTVPKILDLVGLTDQAHKFPSQLSGGQRQRVSIARAIARQPKILIADEPTANIDRVTTHEIIDLLKRINDFGTTVLVTTHDEKIVNLLKKRVITMADGRIIRDQKTNGIYHLEVDTPSASLEVTAPIVIRTPGSSLGKTPGSSLEKTPGSSLGKTPGSTLGKTPGSSLEKTPRKTPDTPAKEAPLNLAKAPSTPVSASDVAQKSPQKSPAKEAPLNLAKKSQKTKQKRPSTHAKLQ